MSNELKPGWAEEMGKIMGSQDEAARAAVSGLTQRRCWRRDKGRTMDSASLGGRKGALTRAARRKLKEVVDE